MLRKLYDTIPIRLRKRFFKILLLAIVAVMADLMAIIGFVPLLAIISNEDLVMSNRYLSQLYQWSSLENVTLFTLLLSVILLCVIGIKNFIVLRISNAQKQFTATLFEALSLAAFRDTFSKGLIYIRQHNSNKLVNEIAHSTLMFSTMVIGGYLTMLSEGFLLVVVCSVVLVYSPIMFIALLLVFVPFALLYTKVLKKKMQKLGRAENELRVVQYRTLAESMRGYTDVKLTGSFERIIDQYRTILDAISEPRVRGEILREMPSRLIEMVVLLGVIVLTTVSLLSDSTAQDGLMLSMGIFVVVAYKVMPAINRMMSAWSTINKCDFAVNFCGDIRTHDLGNEEIINEDFESISLDNVTFGFDAAEPPVFRDFSIKISRGERVLIKGKSGSGKSTLLNLLMGFYRPTRGEILINSKSALDKLYGRIGYVSQEIFIMDDTLTNNITMSGTVDRQRFETAWRLSGIDTIGIKPDERLREWGSRLSGGQRQRIAIARALYRNAELLILDEATASLDQSSENQIMTCLDNLPPSVTIICVTHRIVNDNWREIDICD